MPATPKALTVRARLTRVNVGGTSRRCCRNSPTDWPTDAVAVGDKDYDRQRRRVSTGVAT